MIHYDSLWLIMTIKCIIKCMDMMYTDTQSYQMLHHMSATASALPRWASVGWTLSWLKKVCFQISSISSQSWRWREHSGDRFQDRMGLETTTWRDLNPQHPQHKKVYIYVMQSYLIVVIYSYLYMYVYISIYIYTHHYLEHHQPVNELCQLQVSPRTSTAMYRPQYHRGRCQQVLHNAMIHWVRDL